MKKMTYLTGMTGLENKTDLVLAGLRYKMDFC